MIEETITQAIPLGYVPTYFIFIVAGIMLLSFISLTALYKSRKTNWGNFWKVILFSSLISGIVITFLAVMPEVFTSSITKLQLFMGF